jgi:hypothetical protein
MLALLGRTALAGLQVRRAKTEARAKAEQEAAEAAYKRGREGEADRRAEEGLSIRKAEFARGLGKDAYQKERDAIDDLNQRAIQADRDGDNARADEYLRLAKDRESRLRAADAAGGSAGSKTQKEADIARLEQLFVTNHVAPEQLPGRLPRILKLKAGSVKTPDDLAQLREAILFGVAKPTTEGVEAGEDDSFGAGIASTLAQDPRVSGFINSWLMNYSDILGIPKAAFGTPARWVPRANPEVEAPLKETVPFGPRTQRDELDDVIDELGDDFEEAPGL